MKKLLFVILLIIATIATVEAATYRSTNSNCHTIPDVSCGRYGCSTITRFVCPGDYRHSSFTPHRYRYDDWYDDRDYHRYHRDRWYDDDDSKYDYRRPRSYNYKYECKIDTRDAHLTGFDDGFYDGHRAGKRYTKNKDYYYNPHRYPAHVDYCDGKIAKQYKKGYDKGFDDGYDERRKYFH